MTRGSKRFSTAIGLLLLLSLPTPLQAKDLTEADCKSESMQADVLAAMNQKPVLNPPLKVQTIKLAYLETGRKPYFCAYFAYADNPDGYLFAVTPLAPRSGKRRFQFEFLD
ncbi:hypothetical protein [Microvirga sp. CF3016]|uniref:hypothetical protein n=1 Tax=Microvirga sp. CF3016 TaxID=3110181 RepID=UPI002E767242|nr:hypothetical protein [Microvirga sp. CF3016]MEE1613791.1 hypothetical protein [Microvirga sp. CF3016]